MKKRIKVVQQLQQQKGLHYGEIDGIAGLVTVGGLARIAGINQQWPKTRQITVFIQMEVNDRGAGNPRRTGALKRHRRLISDPDGDCKSAIPFLIELNDEYVFVYQIFSASS